MPEEICQNVPGRQNISNNDTHNRKSKIKQQPGNHKEDSRESNRAINETSNNLIAGKHPKPLRFRFFSVQSLGFTIVTLVSFVLLYSVIISKGSIDQETQNTKKPNLSHDNGIKPKGEAKTPNSRANTQKTSSLNIEYSAAKKYKEDAKDQCFCQLKGHVDDCSCSVDTVDHYNNMKIYPRLKSLLAKDYFRYFHYNPNKACLYWTESSSSGPPEKCTSPRCGVQSCTPEELPPGLKGQVPKEDRKDCSEGVSSVMQTEIDKVDDTISDSARNDIKSWKVHDDKLKGFCEVDDVNDPECIHVDLTINPERFTGYSGEASRKVWRAIYQENCFRPSNSSNSSGAITPSGKSKGKNKLSEIFGVPQERLSELCLEKRAFYRAISGLHTSITIHVASRYPEGKMTKNKRPVIKDFFSGGSDSNLPFAPSEEENFVPNVELFLSRFDSERTDGQGPFWLKNLYFVYLLELRALQKAATYLENESYYTGNAEEDKDTQIAVKELINIVRSFPEPYDESRLFASSDTSEQLKNEFREHFRNISLVMDCVSCDKCKLWGKLQTNGLGTALKILFSDDAQGNPLQDNPERNSPLKLSRNEIVSLFNAFGRISTSIQQLEVFRAMIRNEIS